MRRTGRLLVGVLVAYVLALQGMLGAHAAARHVAPPPLGLLCSGEPAPGAAPDSAPLPHEAACDLLCGAMHAAALPPPAALSQRIGAFAVAPAASAPVEAPRAAPAFSNQQPRAPPFAI